MKLFTSICAVSASLLFSASQAHSAALVFGAAQDNGLSLSSGSLLPEGNLVRAGFFDIDDATIAANSFNISFLNSHFTEFGAARIGDGGLPSDDGIFASSQINRTDSDAAGFANKQIYLWVFAALDNSSNALSISTAIEHGIFYRSLDVGLNWRFRADADTPNNTTIDLSDLTNPAGTALVPGANVVVGAFPKGTSPDGSSPNFALQVVPEPASAGLAIVGGMALLMRRRRRA